MPALSSLSSAKSFGRQVEGHVDVALDQQRAAVAGIGHVALHDAPQLGHRAALPVVITHVDDFLPRAEGLDLEGAATGGVVARPDQAPGVGGGRVLLDQLAVEDAGHRHGQVVHRQLVLADELDAEGVVVDHLELLGLFQRAGSHLEGGKTTDGDGAVEAPLHVLRCDRRAVVELRVLAQLEGDRIAVRRHLPAFGQLGFELVAVVRDAAIGQRLLAVGHQPVVDQPADAVAGPVGADGVDVQRVRAEFIGDDEHVLGPRLGLRSQWQGADCSAAGDENTSVHGVSLVELRVRRGRRASRRNG